MGGQSIFQFALEINVCDRICKNSQPRAMLLKSNFSKWEFLLRLCKKKTKKNSIQNAIYFSKVSYFTF